MKFSKPVTTLVCLLTSTSVFAAEAAKVVAPIAQAAAKNPAPKPLPTTLKISAINGVKNPNHNKTIFRTPGQKISFSADLFVTQKGKLVPQNTSPRDYVWELDDRVACDPARPASCADAGIELTQDGISFILPEDFSDNMKLKVSLASDAKKSDKIAIGNKVLADQRAAEERERAEMARQQAAEEQAAQEERNRQVLGAIFGAVVGGLSAYGEYKAQEQREERHEEMRRQWMQRNNPQTPVITPAPQPQPPVITPAPQPQPQPQPPAGPRPDGGHGGGGGFQGHGGAHGAH